jgi:hypothetical protein
MEIPGLARQVGSRWPEVIRMIGLDPKQTSDEMPANVYYAPAANQAGFAFRWALRCGVNYDTLELVIVDVLRS